MKHIATVQLQDYYQHKVFETVITKRHWNRFESRLKRNVDETMTLLDSFGTKATFFALGWIAEQLPEVIRSIAAEGHEIASSGYWGVDRLVETQTLFREDLRRGKEILEQTTGTTVDGFRCIRRSFGDKDLWLLDIVAEEGYRYDSSVMPSLIPARIETDARRQFLHNTRRGPIHELPHSTAHVLGMRVPIGGGNFVRQMPVPLMQRAFRAWLRRAKSPFVLYFHPWELDDDLPEVSAFGPFTRIRQYRNLGKMRHLLPLYLERARFTTARDYLGFQSKPVILCERSSETAILASAPVAPTRLQDVSVVIPCHNEEDTIPFLERALDELENAAAGRYQIKFILVDDRSTDGTLERIRTTFSDTRRFRIAALGENRGVSGAIHAGIELAESEIVCSMDADCSYDPLELLNMIPLLQEQTAMVTASPYHPDGAVLGVPEWRLFLSRGLSGIYRAFLRHKFATYTSCFRVYRKRKIDSFSPTFGDFRGIVELLAKLDMAGESIVEFPTTLQSRIFGYSKMKTLKTIRDHLRLLYQMPKFRQEMESRSPDMDCGANESNET